MAYENHPNQDDDYREALDRWDLTSNADKEQRRLAIEDLLFIHAEDGQWDEDIITKRKDRPRYTIDKISGALDQLVGDQRQTRTGTKVLPAKDGTEKTGKIYTGLIRNIRELSDADDSYDNAYDEQLTSGYGGWKVKTDYENDNTFDQIIELEPILSAASSYYTDPSSKKYDRSDGLFQFLLSAMVLPEFEKAYPNASVTDFSTEEYKTTGILDWFANDGIRLAEYWYKEPKDRKIGELSDGRVIDLEDEAKVLDELARSGTTVKRERTVKSHDVFMRVMNGAEFLTKPQKWAGKYIPLIPVFGKTGYVDGKIFIRGKVRKAKDAQRIYNYATSAAVETTASTPKDPYFYTAENVKGHEKKWKAFPSKNSPFLPYNADPKNQGVAPQRGGAPTVQAALLQQIQQASMDIHATTGLEPASLGNVPELKSGKAIEAQQAMGDRGSYSYSDNLKKSKKFEAKILVDLIPRIWDTERTIQILGEDEVLEDVVVNAPEVNGINEPIVDKQTGDQVLVNDLAQGQYSVAITSGPAFATKKSETVNQLLNLVENDPDTKMLLGDLIVGNMDLNNGEEINKRFRKRLITNNLVEPTEEEVKELGLDKPQEPDPMQESLQTNLDMQSEKLASDIVKNDAATQKSIVDAQKVAVDAYAATIKAIAEKVNAGLPLSERDLELLEGQQVIVEETQEDVLEGQEIAGSLPMNAKGLPLSQQPPQNIQPQGGIPEVI